MSSGTGSPPGRDSDHDDNEEEVVVKAEDAADSDEAEGEEEFKLRSNGLQDAFKETPGAPTPNEEEAGAEGAEGIKDEEPTWRSQLLTTESRSLALLTQSSRQLALA